MSKQKVWLGVDPGLTKTSPGGISWINEDRTEYQANYMPMSIHGIAELIKNIYLEYEVMFGTIEDIHATGGHNITGQVKMMSSKHYCEAIFATLGIPFGYVTPAKWQPEVLGTGFKSIKHEDKKKQRLERKKWLKNKSLETAQRLFPNAPIKLKKDDGKSDSILIAKYGKDFL